MRRAVIQIGGQDDSRQTLELMGREFVSAWRGDAPSDPIATIRFSSPSQLFSVVTPKRWELIERLQTLGPSSMRGLARALDRDIRRVHDDVKILSEWGIVEKTESGDIVVPYDVIHADFDLRAVA